MPDYNLEGPTWSTTTITYSFATSNVRGQTGSFSGFFQPGAYEQDIVDALARWSAVTPLTFIMVTDSASADIRFGYATFDGSYGTLGETSYRYDQNNHFLPGVIVRFDQAESYTPSSQGLALSSGARFESVATHEIGHALGLDHYNASAAIMNSYASASVNALTQSDIHGIQSLYGPKPAATVTAVDHDFNGDMTSDVLLRNNSNGDVGFIQVNNGHFTAWSHLFSSNTAYSAVGVGDFNGDRTADVLVRNNADGDTGFAQINNGQFTSFSHLFSSNPAYAVVGVGDFNGDHTSDVLLRNNSDGDIVFVQVNNGQFTSFSHLLSSNTAYSVAGVGDFNGDQTSDVLLRNNSDGDVGFAQINNGQFTSFSHLFSSNPAYSVVGVGDFNGDHTSDVLLRNNSDGDIGFSQINNGQFTSFSHLFSSNPLTPWLGLAITMAITRRTFC